MTHTVTGGGLTGLTAAIELARGGARVRLIEQHHELGGRAVTTQKDGFSLNLGPHAVYLAGRMHSTFTQWGVMPPGGQPVLAEGAFMVRKGAKHPFVRNLMTLATSSILSPLERLEAARVFAKLSNTGSGAALTMAQWLDRETSSLPVRQFFEALTRLSTYCGEFNELSAEAALVQLNLAQAGVVYLNDGWQSMIRNLALYARSLGVVIETGKSAEERGILAVSPAEAERISGRSPGSLKPIRMATLDLALHSLPPKAAVFGLGLDEPLYLSVHSTWANVAPPGQATVHIAKYKGAAASDPGCDRAQLERFADLLMPGWRDHVHYARFLPEMTVTHSVVGLAQRPDVDALDAPDLRIAGDWVGPEGMLADAAVASGLRAAQSLLQ